MKKLRFSLFAVLLLWMGAGCSGTKSLNVADLLTGKSFNVESIMGKALNAADLMKGLPYFNFGSDGKLTGSSSCNNFFGTFKVEGSQLSLNPSGMTRMACHGTTEAEFLEAVKQVNGIKTEGKSIKLLNGAQEVMSLVPKL